MSQWQKWGKKLCAWYLIKQDNLSDLNIYSCSRGTTFTTQKYHLFVCLQKDPQVFTLLKLAMWSNPVNKCIQCLTPHLNKFGTKTEFLCISETQIMVKRFFWVALLSINIFIKWLFKHSGMLQQYSQALITHYQR